MLLSLSPDAYRVLCGLVQPTEVVDPSTVTAADDATWEELRAVFPVSGYREIGE